MDSIGLFFCCFYPPSGIRVTRYASQVPI